MAKEVAQRELDQSALRISNLGTPTTAGDATKTDNTTVPLANARTGAPGTSFLAAPIDHVHPAPPGGGEGGTGFSISLSDPSEQSMAGPDETVIAEFPVDFTGGPGSIVPLFGAVVNVDAGMATFRVPWKIVGGVKVFHLVAEEVDHELVPGLKVRCWGYNGRVHGPVIEAVEGDRVRIYVTNRLPEGTTAHWHGVLVPNGMDGVGGLTQKAIEPGETFKYEFTLRQSGTLMYHSHHDEMTQMALGMTGMFIIHPRRRPAQRVDRDFAILLHEWRVDPGAKRPDPNEMTDFNILTMNARAFPGTESLVARTGERVRIRIGNLSAMDHHPIHLHGHHFNVTATDAGDVPASAQWRETTVLVPVGSTRTIEFVAKEPGDWAFHCHMTHHVMNQMAHGLPNIVGIDPTKLDQRVQKVLPAYMTMGQAGMGDMADMAGMPVPTNTVGMLGGRGKHDVITMGGMFTILKVRDHLKGYEDPGWYENPKGTLASPASAADLKRDGIELGAKSEG